MNYKKKKKPNYTLHLINDDRFKTISVHLRFTKSYQKEEAPYLKLLESMIMYNGTKKYKTLKELSRKVESLYRTDISTKFFTLSNNMFFEIKLMFINPKYTSMDIYKETFELLKEIIERPNIKNNKWNEEIFKIEKENLIKTIENIKDTPDMYGRVLFNNEFFKGTVYAESDYKNLKLFENLDNEKLYEIYTKLFTDYKIDVLVFGDFDNDIIESETEKLLKNFKMNDKTNKDLYIDIKNKDLKENKETMELSQSNLYIGLTINNIKEEDKNYKLMVYNTILGNMNNSILFVNVREKNSLCYYIGSTINKYTNSIVIESGINKDNYDLAKKLIKESLESMKDINVVKKHLRNAQRTLEIAYNDFYDNINKIVNFYFLNEFDNIPSIEERREKVRNLKAEEIVELAKKVEMKYIFLLEGSMNEEN